MRAFITQQRGDNEELRTKLEQVESNLSIARKAVAYGVEALRRAKGERETAQAEANHLREEMKAAKAKGKAANQEINRLRRELEES
ncbi:hypothetical protein PVL29_019398 [Vitis rotundifolia]|uniref:Uncharacterized protein n=1 Tax=Vitis rotundifolia TaxID=103349 RepID=A0AA38Z171_VITRO|nr:hypothetical protein PVL29_019398 [Vitis rotundifolia]